METPIPRVPIPLSSPDSYQGKILLPLETLQRRCNAPGPGQTCPLPHSSPWGAATCGMKPSCLLPTCSDQYVMLWGPRHALVLKQAVRWKYTPMGQEAVGQSWSTGLSSWSEREDAWYTLPGSSTRPAFQHWYQAHAGREQDCLPQAYAQHLREVACWDPVVPAQYLGLSTRWGAFLWQEKPIRGKEYIVTRNQSPRELGGSSGYVPSLSFCQPPFTTRDIHSWSHLYHQPSTNQ
ncbi:tektin bundle-interacting protein 1 [Struthio camelus]|uniref:tektin bundle-interacting protein 1 n=1 Tax=Struthio camelus TaxID=8801 RepID=UPI003603CE16